jgi:hypothetical protein
MVASCTTLLAAVPVTDVKVFENPAATTVEFVTVEGSVFDPIT